MKVYFKLECLDSRTSRQEWGPSSGYLPLSWRGVSELKGLVPSHGLRLHMCENAALNKLRYVLAL